MRILIIAPLSAALITSSCKKEEPYNCGASQARYSVLCQERQSIVIKQIQLAADMQGASGSRLTFLIQQSDQLGGQKTAKEVEMRKLLSEMKSNNCPTNIASDCLN